MGFDIALGLGSHRHHKEMYMVIAWLVVKGARILPYIVSKDMLQSCNALPPDPRQLVFVDGYMIHNDFKVALLQLPLALPCLDFVISLLFME